MLEESIGQFGYDAIIVSGYSEFEYARKAIGLGVTEYLLKPVNFNELYDALDKIIRKQTAAARLRDDMKQIDGPESGMTIESSPGNGTKVTVTLPADMEEI